jgi:DNA-binding MarR family transcriptional regulator
MEYYLSEHVGFWLYQTERAVAYAFAQVLRLACLEHGKAYVVTPPQWGVLATLYAGDGLTVGTLGQSLVFDMPTIAGILKRLEQTSLVERQHDQADRRVVTVWLTEEGREATRFLVGAVIAFTRQLTQGFSEDEQQAFKARLRQIIENVSHIAPDHIALLPEQMRGSLKELPRALPFVQEGTWEPVETEPGEPA